MKLLIFIINIIDFIAKAFIYTLVFIGIGFLLAFGMDIYDNTDHKYAQTIGSAITGDWSNNENTPKR